MHFLILSSQMDIILPFSFNDAFKLSISKGPYFQRTLLLKNFIPVPWPPAALFLQNATFLFYIQDNLVYVIY